MRHHSVCDPCFFRSYIRKRVIEWNFEPMNPSGYSVREVYWLGGLALTNTRISFSAVATRLRWTQRSRENSRGMVRELIDSRSNYPKSPESSRRDCLGSDTRALQEHPDRRFQTVRTEQIHQRRWIRASRGTRQSGRNVSRLWIDEMVLSAQS